MNKACKKTLALSVAFALLLGAAGCGKAGDKDSVATVGGDKIPTGVANFYARYQQAIYETNYAAMLGMTGAEMWKNEMSGESMEDSVKGDILTALEELYVLEDHMKDYEIAISEEEQATIQKYATEFIDDNGEKEKEAVSGTQENIERVFELLMIQQKMNTAMTADVNTEVSDEEAAQKSLQYVQFAFEKKEETGESVELSEEEKAELKTTAQAFADSAKGAEAFDTFATEQGQTAQTLTFDSESTAPEKAIIEKADAMAVGEVSDVIETESGYYVVKLISELDRDATDSKKTQIVNERKQEAYTELLEAWKKDTKIEINEKVWDTISFDRQGVTIKEVDTTPYADGPGGEVKAEEEASEEQPTE